MREELTVFELMGETSGSIFPLAQDIMRPLFKEHFSEQRFYGPSFTAQNIAPKPISVELLNKRNPYANPAGLEKLLKEAAQAGYLESKGEGNYVISEKGARAINRTNNAFYNHINKINHFPAEKLNELTGLLGRLVDASSKADLANGTLALDISRSGHPTVEAGSLAQADQQLDDVRAFRDDAHIAAWTPTGVNGHTWETFSFIWNSEANTVEKLVERLPFRNYTAEDYIKTLEELTQRGWIEPGTDGYTATKAGRRLREEAEADTNKNFFTPWQVLTDDEITKLGELLNELKEINIKIMEANKQEV